MVWHVFCCWFFKQSLECFWVCRRLILLVLLLYFLHRSLEDFSPSLCIFLWRAQKVCTITPVNEEMLQLAGVLCAAYTFPCREGTYLFSLKSWAGLRMQKPGSILNTKELSSFFVCEWGTLCNINQLALHFLTLYQIWGKYSNLQKQSASYIWHNLKHNCKRGSLSRGKIASQFCLWSA